MAFPSIPPKRWQSVRRLCASARRSAAAGQSSHQDCSSCRRGVADWNRARTQRVRDGGAGDRCWALVDRAPLGHTRASATLSRVIVRYLEVLSPAAAPSARSLSDALRPFQAPDPTNDLRALFTRGGRCAISAATCRRRVKRLPWCCWTRPETRDDRRSCASRIAAATSASSSHAPMRSRQ